MNKYEELRNQYKNFYYHGFDVCYDDNKILITYDFEIEGLMSFNPTIEIPLTNKCTFNKENVNKLAFHTGLSEIASYWKATCSPNVIIECGYLDDVQIRFLKKLIYNGLGEFFYINKIDTNYDDFMNVKVASKVNQKINFNEVNKEGYLIAVGGGKDSLTSLEILKNEKNKHAFIINNRKVCFDGAKKAGFNDDEIVNVRRMFDKKIIDLNNRGFLNGHTPLSSVIAFISYLTAYVYGFKYVVLSNESSANEASVKGTKINHQYSKSFEFEQDFREYVNYCLDSSISYFSLLRPLNELQIMGIFSKYKKYFKSFISCNNGGKRKNIGIHDGWCNTCSKCLFIFIIMSYFVDEKTMVEIFGENILDNKEMLNYFLDLTGKSASKPFECVGTIDEVKFVVCNLIKKRDKLPYLLEYYKHHFDVEDYDKNILNQFNNEHNLEEKFVNLVRKELFYVTGNN